jgi:hypothetical protein
MHTLVRLILECLVKKIVAANYKHLNQLWA